MSAFYYLARKPWILFFFPHEVYFCLLLPGGYCDIQVIFLRIQVYSFNERGFYFSSVRKKKKRNRQKFISQH